jgi:hypothetical protein
MALAEGAHRLSALQHDIVTHMGDDESQHHSRK